MIDRVRRSFGSLSAWIALFAVAGIAVAARRRVPAQVRDAAGASEPIDANGSEPVSPVAD
jgi:hypothetical protein